MQHPEYYGLNHGGEFTKFFQKIRLNIDTLEQDLEPSEESHRTPYLRDVPENKIYGLVEKQEFKKILDAYEAQQNDQDTSEEARDNRSVSIGTKDSKSSFAQLLHSKPAFHHPGSTDYLVRHLQINNGERRSLLGGNSDYKLEEKDTLKEILFNRNDKLLESHVNAARNYIENGKLDEAWKEIEMAVKVDGKNGNVLAARGKYYIKLQKYLEAINDFKNALRFKPKDFRQVQEDLANALGCQGLVHHQLRQYQEAKDRFEEALQLNCGNVEFHRLNRDMCEGIVNNMKQNPFRSRELYRG